MAFQRRLLFAGVKAEDIFLRRYTQRLNDLAAGIAARLLHHGAILRLPLNGADLEQHGHGQVNTGGDHGQQGHKSHQTPHHPPPFQRGAGQAAFLAFFPPHRIPDLLLLRRAQALTRELMTKYGIPLENVVRHYDVTHKNCPAPFVESASAWTAFKQGLQKKEEPDMTEAEVKKIIESTRRTYNSVSVVPAWAKPTVEKLTRKGWLLGDEHGKLDLTEELLRTLVINDRAGIYGE